MDARQASKGAEERNLGDGFYICQECNTASLYVCGKWERVSMVQQGFQKKTKMGSRKGSGKLPWLEAAEGWREKESFMVKSSATACDVLRSREG